MGLRLSSIVNFVCIESGFLKMTNIMHKQFSNCMPVEIRDEKFRRLVKSVSYNNNNNNNNNNNLLQFGCYPVAVVILHVNNHEIGYY